MNHLIIITHTDLDGVGSAAAYLRIAGRSPSESTIIFAEPYEIHDVLRELVDNVERGDKVALMDLGPNRENYDQVVTYVSSIVRKDVDVEWYDHHIWDDGGERLRAVGARMFIDRSTCATGVVVRYASKVYGVEPDKFLLELERAVCAADLWIWDHPMAPKLFRVIGSDKGDQADEWRHKVVEKFFNSKLWDDEMEERLESYINKELKGYEKVLRTLYVRRLGRRSVAAVVKSRGPPANSLIGALLLSRFNADVAVIVRENGAISLRSRSVDVQRIASLLGGGGHPRASGAKLRLPFWVRILYRFYPKALSRYAASKVIGALKKVQQ